VAATGITTTSATITWTTDQASTTRVAYGTTTAYGTQSPLDSTLLTAHSVTLTGLTPGTTYNYAVTSANGSGTSTTSGNFTFATTAGPGPAISAVTATGITSTSATITWTTDQASTTRVAYGLTTSYGTQSPLDSALVTAHSVTLTGLTPGTTYNYAATSANGAGTSTTSGNFTFATTAAPAGPTISAVTATGITNTSATITWTTNAAATTRVAYGTTTAYGAQSPLDSALVTAHSVTLTGLNPGTTYNYAVTSANSAGTSTTSGNFTFATTGSATPAPAISSVAAWPVGDTTATILWATDQSASSQVKYGTTSALGSLTALDSNLSPYHAVPLTGLTPGTTYHYAVVSTNAGGASTQSATFTFTTTGTAPPPGPVISAVTATAITSNGATISWTTSQPASSQVSFGLTPAYGSVSTLNTLLVTSHTVTLSGLAPGTTYHYAALSTNGTGVAATSGNFTFATTGSVQGPTLSGVVSWGIGGSGATVSWATDQPSDTALEYGLTAALGLTSPVQPALTNSHGVTLSGLQGNTTYHYRARSTNAGGGTGYSAIQTFKTLDVSGPVVSNVVATPASGNSATVSWTVSKPSTCQVEYGPTLGYGWWSPQTTALQTALGWVPSGQINFRIHCVDASGNASVSANYTFTEP
jgi:phosphodiesterase/alkaline phosphatase D-like protein